MIPCKTWQPASVARISAGRVPAIKGMTVLAGKKPKEHQVASPKVTMNHHANAAITAVFAPAP